MRDLAHRLHRRRRRVLWAWPVGVVVAAVLGLPVFGTLGTGNDFDDPAAQAVHARDRIGHLTGAHAAPDAPRPLVRLHRRIGPAPA